jgi:ADP-ribosylglycohydrolase
MNPQERMLLSLTELSVGDALGQTFFHAGTELEDRIEQRQVPQGIWHYTDDMEMALSIAETLDRDGKIDPDVLVTAFATRFNPRCGYGAGA